MNLKFLALLLTLLLFTPNAPGQTEDNNKDWYPFVLSERLDPDSPTNMGKLVLDPPAGKHGFCKVRNGHFYFEDGTRAKFWGTNLCFNVNFPTHEQAEILADRLVFFGFNAIRLTHMDYYFEPMGIFEDTCPDCTDLQMKKTTKLSEKQLDKLDYFIYQLKTRGIYVDINLLVRRHFTTADGVADADKVTGGAKGIALFDQKIIELQKQYAKDLLTHYNPYTKLRYCDDPAIALVEITNENSLFMLNRIRLPYHYQKEFAQLWSDWQIGKGLFNKISNDKFYIDIEQSFFDEMTGFLKNDVGVKVPITGIGGYFNPGDSKAQESCDFIDTHAYWDHPKFPRKSWDINDFTIHNKSMLLDRALGIIGQISKRNPRNNKPFTITEWNHCYPNQFAYETPVLIASEGLKNNWDGLFQFAFSHGWETEPSPDEIKNYFDIIANPQKLILCSVGSYIFSGRSVNMQFRDGVYSISSSKVTGIAGSIKDKTFDLKGISINARQNGAVFLISLENKPINKSNRLLLVTVSEVKNTGSGWEGEKFNWGTSPTLLKKINVMIELATDKNFRVYELDSEGKRGKEIKTEYQNNTLIFSTKDSNSPWFEISSEPATCDLKPATKSFNQTTLQHTPLNN